MVYCRYFGQQLLEHSFDVLDVPVGSACPHHPLGRLERQRRHGGDLVGELAPPGIHLVFDTRLFLDFLNQHVLSRESLVGVLGAFGPPVAR